MAGIGRLTEMMSASEQLQSMRRRRAAVLTPEGECDDIVQCNDLERELARAVLRETAQGGETR